MWPEANFWAYAKIGIAADQGAVIPVRFQTDEDGEMVDLGELHVHKGRSLAGRVILSDGKGPTTKMRVRAELPNANDSLDRILDQTGRFEFQGIPDGPVSVIVGLPDEFRASGYRLSPQNKCLDPGNPYTLLGRLDRDITDLTILLEPGKISGTHPYDQLDPTVTADFNDAKDGPITGVPPRP